MPQRIHPKLHKQQIWPPLDFISTIISVSPSLRLSRGLFDAPSSEEREAHSPRQWRENENHIPRVRIEVSDSQILRFSVPLACLQSLSTFRGKKRPSKSQLSLGASHPFIISPPILLFLPSPLVGLCSSPTFHTLPPQISREASRKLLPMRMEALCLQRCGGRGGGSSRYKH